MGSVLTRTAKEKYTQDEPNSLKPSKYDPQFGFDGKRPARVINFTEEEMDSAHIREYDRDYCVGIRMQSYGCYKYNMPFVWKCRGLQEELEDCYKEDQLISMKEFEREKRLNARERRIRLANLGYPGSTQR